MYDVLENLKEKSIKCLDVGHVRIVDIMPRLVPDDQKTADFAIVQAARVSYGSGTKTVNEDRGLIRYLFRHTHSTPTEMITMKFDIKMPIFCARQFFRHRTSSSNEVSGRYSILKDEFYFPTDVREQSLHNKQGGETVAGVETANEFQSYLTELCIKSYEKYEEYLKKGVSREQARMILPVNLYTQFYWQQNLHNLLHMLALRCDAHAQQEIRTFANAILELIKPLVPFAVEAWDDYHHYRGAIKLSRLEVDAIKKFMAYIKEVEGHFAAPKLDSDNKREQVEWVEKAKKLGISVE